MNKQNILRFVNVLLIFSALIQALSGLLMVSELNVPHFIIEAHESNGPVLILLIIMHTFLNWIWIKLNLLRTRMKGRHSERT